MNNKKLGQEKKLQFGKKQIAWKFNRAKSYDQEHRQIFKKTAKCNKGNDDFRIRPHQTKLSSFEKELKFRANIISHDLYSNTQKAKISGTLC